MTCRMNKYEQTETTEVLASKQARSEAHFFQLISKDADIEIVGFFFLIPNNQIEP